MTLAEQHKHELDKRLRESAVCVSARLGNLSINFASSFSFIGKYYKPLARHRRPEH